MLTCVHVELELSVGYQRKYEILVRDVDVNSGERLKLEIKIWKSPL